MNTEKKVARLVECEIVGSNFTLFPIIQGFRRGQWKCFVEACGEVKIKGVPFKFSRVLQVVLRRKKP